MLIENTKAMPEMTPGRLSGSVTCMNRYKGEAPSVAAASPRRESISFTTE